MSTHVALAQQLIEQYKVTECFKTKINEYESFQMDMALSALQLKEEESALVDLLDEHLFLANNLDKKRGIAITKENNERKLKESLSRKIQETSVTIDQIMNDYQKVSLLVVDKMYTKNVITQVQQEEGINIIEYIESQIALNKYLKDNLKETIKENPLIPSSMTINHSACIKNEQQERIQTAEMISSAFKDNTMRSLHGIENSLKKAVYV